MELPITENYDCHATATDADEMREPNINCNCGAVYLVAVAAAGCPEPKLIVARKINSMISITHQPAMQCNIQ